MTKVEWHASCINCEFIGKFEKMIGISYREFLDILRGECPDCGDRIETFIEGKSLIAKCGKCFFFRKFDNLKNVEEKYLKDKKHAFLYILPKCPKCGSACNVFPHVV